MVIIEYLNIKTTMTGHLEKKRKTLKALFNIVEERFKKWLNFDVCVV